MKYFYIRINIFQIVVFGSKRVKTLYILFIQFSVTGVVQINLKLSDLTEKKIISIKKITNYLLKKKHLSCITSEFFEP